MTFTFSRSVVCVQYADVEAETLEEAKRKLDADKDVQYDVDANDYEPADGSRIYGDWENVT